MFEFVSSWAFWALFLSLPLLYWYFTRNFDHFSKKGISGPRPVVIFGNLIEEISVNKVKLEEKYARLYGKIYGSFRGQTPILTVSDPDLIKQILVKDFHKFADRPTFGNVRHEILDLALPQAVGEVWRRIRSLVSPTFTTGKMKKMFPIVKECARTLINSFDKVIDNNGEVEVKKIFSGFTMEVIGSCAFATKCNTLEDPDHPFLVNARKILNFKILNVLAAMTLPLCINTKIGVKGPFDENVMNYFMHVIKDIIKQRRNQETKFNDFLQLIIDAENTGGNYQDEDDKLDAHHVNQDEEEIHTENEVLFSKPTTKKLTEDEVIAQAVIFFLAGFETTATTITWILYELALNPDIQERLHAEVTTAIDSNDDIDYYTLARLEFLDAVVSETLRLHNPAVKLNRMCTEDCLLGDTGIEIAMGEQVEISAHAVHMNPEFHPDPHKFLPDRFMPENRHKIIPYTYLPFGGGPRHCVGMRFALMETKIALAYIVKHYRFTTTANTSIPPKVERFFNITKSLVLGVKKR